MSYASFCFSVFGNISRAISPYFTDIKKDLQKAGMTYTVDEYLSMGFLTATLTFVVEVIMLSFIFGFIVEPLLAVLMSLLLSIAISGMIFFLFYSYPATVSKTKSKKIRKLLPFAVSSLATISSSKVPPFVFFKTISNFKEYGEIAKEAENIVRDVELFGMTTSAAIKKQAKRSPSKEFRELLWSTNTIMNSGGDLTSFLKQKGEEMMADYRRQIRKYSQDLSLYVEIYLTLIITGSIFFIVLSSIISTLSVGIENVLLQSFIVFILLPVLSIGFIVIIKSAAPE
jgi:flagellar protein FlaJ